MSITIRLARDEHLRCGKKRGSPTRTYFSLKRDENHNCIYEERDVVNIQEDIDSYKDLCSLECQLMRLNLMPVDKVVSSLIQKQTVGADVSNIPNNIYDYNAIIGGLKKQIPDFDNLIKSKSFDEILSTVFPPAKKKTKTNKITETEVNENGTNE